MQKLEEAAAQMHSDPTSGEKKAAAVSADQKKTEPAATLPSFHQIWQTADESIDWTDILSGRNTMGIDPASSRWKFLRIHAENILKGSLEDYAAVLKEVRPLDDMKKYAHHIRVRALSADEIAVSYEAFEDDANRSAVLSAYTEPQTAPIRQVLYDYHRLGLDQMALTVDKGRSTITHTLENLGKIYEVAPMSVCLSMFKDAKLDELINIYSKANTTEKESVYEMLYQVYPSENTRLEKIKQTSNN